MTTLHMIEELETLLDGSWNEATDEVTETPYTVYFEERGRGAGNWC
ncbi:hypothetical protein SHJG_0131 [Streptomyces hygroscopicus subsp. jinggangensis 5008]|nr:hypothetical protein SHJG_0131 [Streptomyces hygroscopicus subsp. jinggangensis 5008]